MTTDQVPDPVPVPTVIPAGVPPGLEYLIPTNQIIIQEIRQGLFSQYDAKQYDIFDAWGRRIYSATETSSNGCNRTRDWNIEIFDCMGNSVISGIRTGDGPCSCDSNQVFVASTPTGMSLGGVSELPQFIGASWHILDESGTPILFLEAPVFSGGLFEREFPLCTLNEPREQLGMITKKFTGFFEYEQVFGVELPVNLDPKIKAVMSYASFLIDFQFYERQ